mgnify:FL=1
MLKFLSNNFVHEAGSVNEDALRALIYVSWFSGTITDIIKLLIMDSMEQLSRIQIEYEIYLHNFSN